MPISSQDEEMIELSVGDSVRRRIFLNSGASFMQYSKLLLDHRRIRHPFGHGGFIHRTN